MSGEIGFFEIGVPERGASQSLLRCGPGLDVPPDGRRRPGVIETPNGRGGLHDGDAERNIVLYFAVADIDAAVGAVAPAAEPPTTPSMKPASAGSAPAATTRACPSASTSVRSRSLSVHDW